MVSGTCMGLNRLFDVLVRLPFDGHAIPRDLIEIDLRYIAVVGPVMAPGYVLAPQTRD